jgi:hypothetical protein
MKKKQRKRTIWVAVVVRLDGSDLVSSNRTHGDWGAFISEERDGAIEQARVAQLDWERKMGPIYTIVVGKLEERVVFPTVFTLESL